MEAIVNQVFTGTFRLPAETAANVTAYIYSHNDQQIGEALPMAQVNGGYHFEHTFTTAGHFKIKIVDSEGNDHYTSIAVGKNVATSEEVADVKASYEENTVIVKESSVYIKQLLTSNFIAGGPVDFSFVFTPNENATTEEQGQLGGTWDEGIHKNLTYGIYSTSAEVSDLTTYHNGVYSIFATHRTSGIVNNQSQTTDANYQWQVTALQHANVQDPEVTSIPNSGREAFSIRNYTVAQDADSVYNLLTGEVYRTSSSYGSVGSSDVVIGSVLGTIPSAHANVSFTITKEGTSEEVTGRINLAHGEAKDVVERLLCKEVIKQVNNHASFNDGFEWTYDAAGSRINTKQPYLSRFDVDFTLNNTDGAGTLGVKTIELVETTALLSSGLSEDERTAVLTAASADNLSQAKTEILASHEDLEDKLRVPWL